VKDHYIICGYGVKGRSAARALCESGVHTEDVVIVERDRAQAEEASLRGHTVIVGDATRSSVLQEAEVAAAKAVVFGLARDDTAVLATLTARDLAPEALLVAAVLEDENAHLLRQSGADEVITSSETAGRFLGLTTRHPRVGEVLSDFLHSDYGLSLREHLVTDDEVGCSLADIADQRTVAIKRGDEVLRYDDPRIGRLQRGDRLVGLPRSRGPGDPVDARADPTTDDATSADAPADDAPSREP